MKIKSANLCCSVNPLGQCKNCGAKICRDHLMEQRVVSRPTRDRWYCTACGWIGTVYSYPLRTYENKPNQLVEIDASSYLQWLNSL